MDKTEKANPDSKQTSDNTWQQVSQQTLATETKEARYARLDTFTAGALDDSVRDSEVFSKVVKDNFKSIDTGKDGYLSFDEVKNFATKTHSDNRVAEAARVLREHYPTFAQADSSLATKDKNANQVSETDLTLIGDAYKSGASGNWAMYGRGIGKMILWELKEIRGQRETVNQLFGRVGAQLEDLRYFKGVPLEFHKSHSWDALTNPDESKPIRRLGREF